MPRRYREALPPGKRRTGADIGLSVALFAQKRRAGTMVGTCAHIDGVDVETRVEELVWSESLRHLHEANSILGDLGSWCNGVGVYRLWCDAVGG